MNNMRLLFSEYKSDYSNYIFPYAIWAFPEDHETPAMIFAQGFLPSTHKLDRFYMCRHIRINLKKFSRSSENRRIFRKCEGLKFELIPRPQFDYSEHWRQFCKEYADIKFGKDIMTYQRLDSVVNSRSVSHILLFTDSETNKEVGLVALYLEKGTFAFYYYAFYDIHYRSRNLGMFMMTAAVDYFAQIKYDYIYLGTCYSRNALYKTQFSGCEFFNGFQWSTNLKELKYLIQREKSTITQHLLETEEYQEEFYKGNLQKIIQENAITVNIKEK